MNVNEKIRIMREVRNWTQEEMAEKLGMSHNGYAKIERGETKLYLEKLNQIAQIFNINLSDLVSDNDKTVFFFLNETHDQTSANYYGSDASSRIERPPPRRNHRPKRQGNCRPTRNHHFA